MSDGVEEVAAVAAKLTEAQRWTIGGPIRHSYGDTMARVGRKTTILALNRLGLLNDIRFTPLGLAVRNHISPPDTDGGSS